MLGKIFSCIVFLVTIARCTRTGKEGGVSVSSLSYLHKELRSYFEEEKLLFYGDFFQNPKEDFERFYMSVGTMKVLDNRVAYLSFLGKEDLYDESIYVTALGYPDRIAAFRKLLRHKENPKLKDTLLNSKDSVYIKIQPIKLIDSKEFSAKFLKRILSFMRLTEHEIQELKVLQTKINELLLAAKNKVLNESFERAEGDVANYDSFFVGKEFQDSLNHQDNTEGIHENLHLLFRKGKLTVVWAARGALTISNEVKPMPYKYVGSEINIDPQTVKKVMQSLLNDADFDGNVSGYQEESLARMTQNSDRIKNVIETVKGKLELKANEVNYLEREWVKSEGKKEAEKKEEKEEESGYQPVDWKKEKEKMEKEDEEKMMAIRKEEREKEKAMRKDKRERRREEKKRLRGSMMKDDDDESDWVEAEDDQSEVEEWEVLDSDLE